MKQRAASMLTAAVILSALLPAWQMDFAQAETNMVLVTDAAELITALDRAKAGDEIVLREGTYVNDEWLGEWAAFFSKGEGTAEQPIILRSEDPEHPATISAATQESKNALYIFGDYWIIKDLRISNAAKGIMLDNSNYTVITGCEVFDIGTEAIHIRDNSSYCLVENCHVHDAGTVKPQYGEGVYIGSAYQTEGYGFDCHYNTVRGCHFGPNIAADHVDIKEYTIGNLVEYCTFDGTGMQGMNGGNSFVEIKGNQTIVRNNVGYRNGCDKVLYGFDMSVQVEGWGQDNLIYDNMLYLDTADCYIVKGWNCSAQVFRNETEPAGLQYDGNRILQVLGYELQGDVTEDGIVNFEDILRLQDYLVGEETRYLSAVNADCDGNQQLDGVDLTLVNRMLLTGDIHKPKISVAFQKEKDGFWRMTDGLGGKTVTFYLKAGAGHTLNLGWGYYDPNFVNDDGSLGKWIQNSIGDYTLDEQGETAVTVEVPAEVRRVALDIYGYKNGSEKLEKGLVSLIQAIAE